MKYILLLVLILMGCGASSMPDSTILQKADQAEQTAQEICLLAHSINARTNAEPHLSIVREKIDAICDPALDALSSATASSAIRLLNTLRTTISELMQ